MINRPDLKIELHRSVFHFKHELVLCLEIPFGESEIQRLIRNSCKLLEHCGLHGLEIVNRKGADRGEYNESQAVNPEQEIFFAAGEVAVSREPEKDEQDELGIDRSSPDISIEPFDLRLSTRFKEFGPAGSIIHSLIERRLGPIPEESSVCSLASIAGIKFDTVRLAIDFFRPHFFSMFGATPTVTESILLLCDKSRLRLEIFNHNFNPQKDLPLSLPCLFDELSGIVNGVTGYNLKIEFKNNIRA